ncbi:DUF933 domain-containing protein [Chloroflexota bacterium]
MSASFGIIGPDKSGRKTILNALTKGKADTQHHIHESTPHIVTVKVPEPRLNVLADMLHPKKVIPAEVTYTAITGQPLTQLSNVDAIITVIRAFEDESIPHPEGSVDTERDIATMTLELSFSDLGIIERRQERIELSLKGAKPPERQILLHEQEMLMKFKSELEKDVPIRELSLTTEEIKAIASYQFLTAKPLLIVVNIGEEQLPQAASLETELNSHYSRPKCRIITLCGKLEMELAQLDDSAAEGFRTEFGISEAGVDHTIKLSYELLGLISFFTTASAEVKVWSIENGTTALKAAGKIHSDMERAFIRAEAISYDDLVACGSLAEARKKGLLRLEGKSYVIQDGDIITFLFNL